MGPGKLIYPVLFLSFAVLAFASCKHDPMPSPANPSSGAGGPADPDNPSFVSDVLPIFISHCSGCHNQSQANDGYIFTSYETITGKKFEPGNLDNTKLYRKITEDDPEDRMPKAPNPALSAEQITLIRNWILNGAPNN
jgi:hypothetical protein